MKNKHRFRVNFILRSRKNAEGKFPVYARVIVNGNRVELTTNNAVAAEEWSHGNGEALAVNDDLIDLNQQLYEMKKKLEVHFTELSKRLKVFTAEHIKCAYLGIEYVQKEDRPKRVIEIEPEKTLLWLFKEHNLLMKSVLNQGTMKNYFTTEGYLKKFLAAKFASGDILLSDLTYSFITHFEHYVRTQLSEVENAVKKKGLITFATGHFSVEFGKRIEPGTPANDLKGFTVLKSAGIVLCFHLILFEHKFSRSSFPNRIVNTYKRLETFINGFCPLLHQ